MKRGYTSVVSSMNNWAILIWPFLRRHSRNWTFALRSSFSFFKNLLCNLTSEWFLDHSLIHPYISYRYICLYEFLISQGLYSTIWNYFSQVVQTEYQIFNIFTHLLALSILPLCELYWLIFRGGWLFFFKNIFNYNAFISHITFKN